MAPVPLVAQTARGVDQFRERRLFHPERKGVIARIAHPNHLMRLFDTIRVTSEADGE
jgi:hypothetical protein